MVLFCALVVGLFVPVVVEPSLHTRREERRAAERDRGAERTRATEELAAVDRPLQFAVP